MDFSGILVGLAVFVIIGALHPVVIKAEYHIGKKSWPLFAAGGLLCGVASVLIAHQIVSILLGVLAFSLFWSIHEVYEQEERVRKSWYPANPKKRVRAAAREKAESEPEDYLEA